MTVPSPKPGRRVLTGDPMTVAEGVAFDGGTNTGAFSASAMRPFEEPLAAGAPDRATARRSGGIWQVSTTGGTYPRWRPDGQELYYLGPDGQMMAAPINTTGLTLEPGPPVALFPTKIYGGGLSRLGRQYDVARDGRFLINTVLDETPAPITLLQNWRPPEPK